jgi:hypothetical protein
LALSMPMSKASLVMAVAVANTIALTVNAQTPPPPATVLFQNVRNAELLALSGPRSPYPGKLGVVAEGSLADLLLIDGDPVANIKLIEDPAKHFVVIMKDGRIHKNTLK